MSESKFKTMRHIETVRNYLGEVAKIFIDKAAYHDQSKLQSPEVEIFEEYTPKLRDCTYGSDEYKEYLKEMQVGLKHHYENNTHHPEHFENGIHDMNLLQIIEMVCDWNAATMRHANGNIYDSLELNQQRFGYSDELKQLMKNTVDLLRIIDVKHHAEES